MKCLHIKCFWTLWQESLKETLQKTQEEAEQITEEIQKLEQQTATIKVESPLNTMREQLEVIRSTIIS